MIRSDLFPFTYDFLTRKQRSFGAKCEVRQLAKIGGDLSEKLCHMDSDSGLAALNGFIQSESILRHTFKTH